MQHFAVCVYLGSLTAWWLKLKFIHTLSKELAGSETRILEQHKSKSYLLWKRVLNVVACRFATQNIFCRQWATANPLLWLCQGRTHIIPAVNHTNTLYFADRDEEEGEKKTSFGPFGPFYLLPGVIWHPSDQRIRKQCEGPGVFL